MALDVTAQSQSGVRPATVRSSIGRSHGFLTRTTNLLTVWQRFFAGELVSSVQ